MSETDIESELDEVLGLVANETRFDILRVLWDAYDMTEGPEPDSVPFSELREQVGVRDSGRFNYHLDELIPQFVQDHEDGYTLTYAGGRIIGAAVSGVYTDRETEIETTPFEDCSREDCDGTLEFGYETGHVVLECDSCADSSLISAPPILVGAHDPQVHPDVFRTFSLTRLQQIVRGFCLLCSGPLDSYLPDPQDQSGESITVFHECQECGAVSHTSADTILVDEPAVISLLNDAGIDYREAFHWRQHEAISLESSLASIEPVRVEITMAVEGSELTVEMDENLDVIETTRVS